MDTMIHALIWAWTLYLIPNGDLEFDSSEIFENEAGSSSDSSKIELFHFSE